MRFTQLTPALFAASTLAATFEGFHDVSCQRYQGDYKLITLARQEQLILDTWASTPTSTEASRAFPACPSNGDDTYKWISVPELIDEPTRFGGPDGGAMAVVYFNKTDTYYNCRYLASVQLNGYQGICN